MKESTKCSLDDWGSVLGRWMPKVVTVGYYIFFACVFVWVVSWFMSYDWDKLPKDPIVGAAAAGAVAAFPTAILAVLTKLLGTLTEIAFKAMNGGLRNDPT